ncbi:MAG: hypothetical protein U0939_23800 [Pirellulales bacterium]
MPDEPTANPIVTTLSTTFTTPKSCGVGPTTINMMQAFPVEVVAEKDGYPAQFVSAIGFTNSQPVDNNWSSAQPLMRIGNTSSFSSSSVPFRSPKPATDFYCKNEAPYPALKVRVWTWFRDPLNPMQPKLSEDVNVADFCGKCWNAGIREGELAAPAPPASLSATPSTTGWLKFNRIAARSLDHFLGARIDLAPGVPLRASRIDVFAPVVRWSYAPGPGKFVTSPLGTATAPAGTGFRFPDLPPHALVIWQIGGAATVIESQNRSSAMEIETLPDRDIYVHVNDLFFIGPADNSGSFSLRVRLS